MFLIVLAFRISCLLLISSVLILSFNACTFNNKPKVLRFNGYTMGTTYNIIYIDRIGNNYQDSIDTILQNINNSLSTFIENSTISKVNQYDTIFEVDKYFVEVFNKAKQIHEETRGAFNPSIMPLVNAWGFGYIDVAVEPDSNKVDSMLSFVKFEDIYIKLPLKLIKKNPAIQIDFSAIAKGYGVDKVAQFLENNDIHHYMVEIGGEVRTKGRNEKRQLWRIGIDKPVNAPGERTLYAIVQLNGIALATSGNYRNFYIKEGKRYVHTINPETGYPELNSLLSASVFTGDCILADAYATAFMVMGLEKAFEFVNNDTSLEAYFIYYNELDGTMKALYTAGIEEMLIKEKEEE